MTALFGQILTIACAITVSLPALASSIAGRVVNIGAEPVPGAQVFLEPGLTRPVRMETSDSEGRFHFDDIPPGLVGLFAYAPGRSFGGKSIEIGANDAQDDHAIVLGDEGRVSLKVVDAAGDPLSDARVIGIGLQESRVGIPLQKLRRFGFQAPSSDRDGNVVISRLPSRENIAIKVVHARHAQEVVRDVVVGTADVNVVLSSGVLTSGTVISQQKRLPVPNAPILFKNAFPPYDTSITRANQEGIYYVRLRPGRYFYESLGATFASVRIGRVDITGEYETQQLDMVVAGTGSIHGEVRDVFTEEGIAGVRVLLETAGVPNSVTTTGESGKYEFTAPEGVNTIRFRRALGYMNPVDMTETVIVSPHERAIASTIYLRPIPEMSIRVQDETGESVLGAVARLIQPEQLGWYGANDEGVIDLDVASLPPNGVLIGVAEHPSQPLGALFRIEPDESKTFPVILKEQRKLFGQVTDEDGDALAGWVVHCETAGSDDNSIRLWSAITDEAGRFRYPAVPIGETFTYWSEPIGESEPDTQPPVSFELVPDGPSTMPTLIMSGGKSLRSLQGKSFPWRSISGANDETFANQGTVIVFASTTETRVFLNTLEIMSPRMQIMGWMPVVISQSITGLESDMVRVFSGERPGPAQTYVVDAQGTVIYETLGLPAYGILRELESSTP